MLFEIFKKPEFKSQNSRKISEFLIHGSSTLAKNYRRIFKFIYFHVYFRFQTNLAKYSFGSLPLWLQQHIIIDKEKEKKRKTPNELVPELQLNNRRFFINVKELPNTGLVRTQNGTVLGTRVLCSTSKQASVGPKFSYQPPLSPLHNIKESIDFTFVKRMAMLLFERSRGKGPYL